MCNPNPDTNIDGKPLTQLELVRVAPEHERFADEALHEIERRLLGQGQTRPLTNEAQQVWAAVATYLDGRIQATPAEKPGRKPDMSAPAAAMREVLAQLTQLRAVHDLEEARREAGLKLRGNHARVLLDVCNPSAHLNIDGKPLTQLELVRVSPKHKDLAGEALCEIERRLLGEGWSDAPTDEAAMVWAEVATYLGGRIQGTPEEKPGREPDMSARAATAMREVLQQLASGSQWQTHVAAEALAAKMQLPASPEAHAIYQELLMPAGEENRFHGLDGSKQLMAYLMHESENALKHLAEGSFHACFKAAAVPHFWSHCTPQQRP